MADNPRIDELRRRLEKEPGSRLFAQLAEELRKEGELTDAIRVARTGLLQHPAYPSAHMTLGRALKDTGDLTGARAQFEAVLRGAPDNILAGRFLGETLEGMGDLGSALLQYRATLRQAPGDRQLEAQIRALEERLNPVAQPRTAAPRAEPPRPMPVVVSAEPSTLPPSSPPFPVEPPPVPSTPPPAPEPPRDAEPTPRPVVAPARIVPPGERGGPREPAREAAPAPPVPPFPAMPPPPPPPAPGPASASPGAFAPPAEMSFDLEAPFDTATEALVPRVPEPSPSRFPQEPPEVSKDLPPTGGHIPMEGLPAAAEPPRPVPAEPVTTLPPIPSAPAPPVPLEAPALSSSTLAELYFRQGFVEQAAGVYRELVQREPGNERIKARLAEITALGQRPGPSLAGGGPTADPRMERRRVLEQTIARFEGMLAALRRG